MPRTHAWTRMQRCLLIASVATGLAAFALLIYGYERYYRGPGQEALVGVWECTAGCLSEHFYLRFEPTHNVEAWSKEGEYKASYRGRWYAGGDFLYLRFIGEDIAQRHPITIWRIDDLTTTEMRLRSSDITHTMTRITSGLPSNASNQGDAANRWPP
jgi:hypothetical protein